MTGPWDGRLVPGDGSKGDQSLPVLAGRSPCGSAPLTLLSTGLRQNSKDSFLPPEAAWPRPQREGSGQARAEREALTTTELSVKAGCEDDKYIRAPDCVWPQLP